jgi:peptidoglycan/xylan/chitin deacetylase (PgdA/CDA1 family)
MRTRPSARRSNSSSALRNAAKAAARRLSGALALAGPLSRRTRAELRRRVGVAYCHYAGDPASYEADFDSGLTLARFNELLGRLAGEFRFAPLEEVVRGDGADHKPLLAITFDDGFDLLRGGVGEVLERHGIRATTFVIEGTVGNGRLMWRHALSAIRSLTSAEDYVPAYNRIAAFRGLTPIETGRDLLPVSLRWPMELKEALVEELWGALELPSIAEYLAEECPYFTWEGLEEWRDRGHAIGLHTNTHPVCSRLAPGAVPDEVTAPAERLRERFDLEFLPFSYPFGARLDPITERELVETGVVDAAFGIDGFSPRGTPPFSLERASLESDPRFEVFGRALLGLPR